MQTQYLPVLADDVSLGAEASDGDWSQSGITRYYIKNIKKISLLTFGWVVNVDDPDM